MCEPGTCLRMDIAEEVLLLDDDPAMLVFLEGILTGAGYPCRTETNPEAALSHVASSGDIGLVLSDVCMPGLTGLQFIDRLHALRLDELQAGETWHTDIAQDETDIPAGGHV